MIRKFLLVDDDPDDGEMFSEALQEIDNTIEFCFIFDPSDLVTKIRGGTFDPDIIFLDVNMPRVSGWKCLEELKRDSKLRDIPVVMYSTSSLAVDATRAISNGAFCYLQKPMNFVKLKEILTVIKEASPQTLLTALRRIEPTNDYRFRLS